MKSQTFYLFIYLFTTFYIKLHTFIFLALHFIAGHLVKWIVFALFIADINLNPHAK
jgi:hypothetical protein